MTSHAPASRFFGVDVPLRIADEIDGGLLDYWTAERGHLVDAHVKSNVCYFGGIDKTLAGFVILDDEGDNYTLLDLRGRGRVWWQDHETRELELWFDSFEDWLAFREEVANDKEERSEWEIREAFRKPDADGDDGRTPSSADLAERNQWLMWLLSQPLIHEGGPMQSPGDLANTAASHYLHAWPDAAAVEAALETELPLLRDDPHLAIYWLLHTSLLAMEPERAQVLAEISAAAERPALLDAFVEVFGALPLDGDVPSVPDFRTRRSLMFEYANGEDAERPRATLTAMEIAPELHPLARATWVIYGLNEQQLAPDEVTSALDRIPDTLATAVLRARADREAGRERSPHADRALQLLPASTEPWNLRVWVLENVAPLIDDGPALASIASSLLEKDPYSRPCLKAVAKAHELSGEPLGLSIEELARRTPLADASGTVLQRLQAEPNEAETILAGLDDPAVVAVVAQRVLGRADLDEPSAATVEWALRIVLDSDLDDRAELAAEGLAHLPADSRASIIKGLEIDSPESPLTTVLLRMLEHTPEPAKNDIVADMYNDDLKKAVLKSLFPIGHEPRVFDELMRMAAAPAPGSTLEQLWNEWFYPLEPERCVLPRLTGEQASRAAAAMIDSLLHHPDIQARNTAGHQLYRFDHQGAEAFLIESLNEYGERYADSDPETSPQLSHGQTLDSQLEDVVADLYAAVRNMKTPTARTALIERLFTERRSIWRMCNALSDIFSAEVHQEVMGRLRETRDHRAAAHYANSLAGHVKKRWPMVKLLEEIAAWPAPEGETDRRVFKYALAVGIEAALEAKDFALVRTAHELMVSIAEAAIEPDDLVRGHDWTNPLDALGAQLEAALSGDADAAVQALVDLGEAARAAGRPLTKISDDDLAVLARTTVRERLLHDKKTGEVWFLDPEGAVCVFDGYAIAEPPFASVMLGYRDMKDFLTGVTAQSERTMFWNKAGMKFTELVRYGERLVYRWGTNNGSYETLGFTFPDPTAAAVGYTRLKTACEARKLIESDPWYLPGKGAIVRMFRPDDELVRLMAFDRARFVVDPARAAECERTELEMHLQGVPLSCPEWTTWDGYKVRAELTVAEWMRARIRLDAQDAAWHIESLQAIYGHLETHGFLEHVPALASLHVEIGPPAEASYIERLEEQGVKVADSMRELWGRIGWAEWSLGEAGMRVLSPAESLASLPAMREFGEQMLAQVKTGWDDEHREAFRTITAISAFRDETVDTFMTNTPVHSEDRVYGQSGRHPADIWWERALNWMFATSFLAEFERVIEEAAPETALLYCDQHLGAGFTRRRFEADGKSGTKFWEIYTDPALDVVATRNGKVGTTGSSTTNRFGDPAKAAAKAAKQIAAKVKDGYVEVDE